MTLPKLALALSCVILGSGLGCGSARAPGQCSADADCGTGVACTSSLCDSATRRTQTFGALTWTLTVSPASVAAGVNSTVTISVKDAASRPVGGQAFSFSAGGAGNTFVPAAASGTTDLNGNFSARLSSTVAQTETVTATSGANALSAPLAIVPGPPSPARSSLTLSGSPAIANGASSVGIAVLVNDAWGNAIAGHLVNLTASGIGNTLAPASGSTDAAGRFSAQLTSTKIGSKTVAASVPTVFVLTSPAAFSPGPGILALTATPVTQVANNLGFSSLLVTLKDANGNPVAGEPIALLLGAGSGTFSPSANGVTDVNGAFSGTRLTSTVAETKTLVALDTAASGSSAGARATATVVFTPYTPVAATSSLGASPSSVLADGVAASQITLVARDAYANVVPGQTVKFAVTGVATGTAFNPASAITDANGQVQTLLTSTTTGAKTVLATVVNGYQASTSVSFTPGAADAAQSSLTATSAPVLANGVAQAALTATVRDALGNPVPGQLVTFASNGASALFHPGAATALTNAAGVASVTLSSTSATPQTLSASAGAMAFTQTPSVSFTPGAPAAATSSLTLAGPFVADGTSGGTVTLNVQDANHNPVPGRAVTFSTTSAGASLAPAGGVTDASGNASSALVSSLAGAKTLHAAVGTAFTLSGTAAFQYATALSATPSSLTADGAAFATVTVTVRQGAAGVAGQSVALTASGSDNVFTSPALTNSAGAAVFRLTSTTAEAKQLSASVAGVTTNAATVVFTPPSPPAGRQLCVANFGSNQVLAFDAEATGDAAPLRSFGDVTRLGAPSSVAVDDAHDEIWVADSRSGGLGGGLLVYARGAAGNAAPLRRISVPLTSNSTVALDLAHDEVFVHSGASVKVISRTATGVAPILRSFDVVTSWGIVGLAVDGVRDQLIVVDGGGNAQANVYVYARTAVAGDAPLRTLRAPGMSYAQAATYDAARGEVYVGTMQNGCTLQGCQTDSAVFVLDQAGDGQVIPLRKLLYQFPFVLAFDAGADQLYVGQPVPDRAPVAVFPRDATGNAAPLRTLTWVAGRQVSGLAVDSAHDTFLITDDGQATVSTFARAATGTAAPLTTIVGPPVHSPRSLVMAANGSEILVGSGNPAQVAAFAANANGPAAVPVRPPIRSGYTQVIGYDPTRDEVYASAGEGGTVYARLTGQASFQFNGLNTFSIDNAAHEFYSGGYHSLQVFSAQPGPTRLRGFTLQIPRAEVLMATDWDPIEGLLWTASSDGTSGHLQVYRPDGTLVRSLSGFRALRGVAIDPVAREVFVSDRTPGDEAVLALSMDGNLGAPLRRISGPSTGLLEPQGMVLCRAPLGPTTLSAPQNLIASGTGPVNLSWDPVAGAAVYRVLRRRSTQAAFEVVALVHANAAVDPAVFGNDLDFVYAVHAVALGVTSPNSAEVHVLTPAGVPQPPTQTLCVLDAPGAGYTSLLAFPFGQSGGAAPLRSLTNLPRLYAPVAAAVDELHGEVFTLSSDPVGVFVDVFSIAATGAATPLRQLRLPGNPAGLAIDPGHDELFVATAGAGVDVYARTASGSDAPLRQLALPNSFLAIALDPLHDELVALTEASLFFFSRAAAGSDLPLRRIDNVLNPAYGQSLAVDPAHDEVFVLHNPGSGVELDTYARTASGPAPSLPQAGTPFLRSLSGPLVPGIGLSVAALASHLAYDPAADQLVLAGNEPAVHAFARTASGADAETFGYALPDFPRGIAVGASGIWLPMQGWALSAFDGAGVLLRSIAPQNLIGAPIDLSADGPTLLVYDLQAPVTNLTALQEYSTADLSRTGAVSGDPLLNGAAGFAVDTARHEIYLLQSSGPLAVVMAEDSTAAAAVLRTLDPPPDGRTWVPGSIAVDPQHGLVFIGASAGGGAAILVYSSQGGPPSGSISGPSTSLTTPYRLAWDPRSDALFVLDGDVGTPSGVRVLAFGRELLGDPHPIATLQDPAWTGPQSIFVDAASETLVIGDGAFPGPAALLFYGALSGGSNAVPARSIAGDWVHTPLGLAPCP